MSDAVADPRRRRPPEPTLRWVTEQLGPGSRIVRLRRMALGGWHANHALSVVDGRGRARQLVLRRWARPEWSVEDPDFTADREATVLDLLADSAVPAPRLVAADTRGEACDVPTLLLTRLPGHPPGLPRDMDAFVAQLATTLAAIHAQSHAARDRLPAYRRYYDAVSTPRWSRRPALWDSAIAFAAGRPPNGPRGLIHRDYHPENTLWSRGRLTGVVDWTSASWGALAVDRGHMRWNLALTYGADVADAFLRHCDAAGDQPYWDVVTVLDLVAELDPAEWAEFDLERLERYVEGVLAGTS